ncbi:MAG: disulfide bond formation protein B [Candidatus Methylopumilus sp.]|nr:disulfide bond formation protein B [Candidatus Methylopumilus sp.]
MKNFFLSHKQAHLIAFFAAYFLVALAIVIQKKFNLEPCPLCITQRIIFMVLGGLFLIISFIKPNLLIKKVSLFFLSLTSIVGMIFSFKHILIQSKAIDVPSECGVDLNYMFENFPFSKALNLLFKGTGDCSHIDWTFLGITIPELSLMAFILFFIYAMFLFRANVK